MAKKIVDETLKFEVIINGDKAKKEYGQLERATKKLLDQNEDLEKQAKKLERSRKDNSEAIKKLRNEIEKNNRTVQENESRMKQLSREMGLNNLSMRELGKESRRLNGIMSNLDPESEKWAELNKELKVVKGRMSEIREEMRPVKESMEGNIDLVGGLTAGFGQLFVALNSGDSMAAKAAIMGLMDSLKGATKAGLAFIATPIGAAIAAIAGIGLLAKEWFSYNEAAREAIILTQQITGLQGQQADATRLQAQAISDSFDVDFAELLTTANRLSKNFGISFTEALDEIEMGLIKGGKTNDEFFDSLKEYPVFFASAGFSAGEFRKIIEAGYDLGVYSDKLPDAIKEADISLREQTTATRDALVNAFGAPFTDELLSRVKRGETTTKGALSEISAQAVKTGLNVQQSAQLTADLFRGAGEDAGGAVFVLEAFNSVLNQGAESLTPLEERLKAVAEANLELAKAQDEALKSENYVAYSNQLKLFWIDVKTQFFRGIKYVTDLWTQVDEFLMTFLAKTISTFSVLPQVARDAFGQMKDEVWDVLQTFNGLGDVLKNLMSFNFDEAKESFTAFKQNFRKEVGDVAVVANVAINKIRDARKIAADYVAAEYKNRRAAAAEEIATGEPVNGTVTGNGYGGGGQELTPEDKRKLDSRKRLAELLDQFEAERAIQEQLKTIDKEKRAEEEEILKLELKFQKLTEQAAGEAELLARLEAEKEAQIQDVRDKYAEERTKKEEEVRKKLTADTEKFNEGVLASETKLEQARASLKNKGLEMLKRVAGESSLIGKAIFAIQKGMAISAIITETAKANGAIAANLAIANTKALAASPLTFGQPWVTKNTLAAAAAATANNSASAINIATIAAETVMGISGFEKGLYPVRRDDGKTFQSRFGGEPSTQVVTAPTHFMAGEVKPEMIIDGNTFKKMDPAIIDYILSLAGRSPGFENGMYPPSNGNQEAIALLASVIDRLSDRLDQPFVSNVYYGPEASRKQKEVDDRLKRIRNNAKLRRNGRV